MYNANFANISQKLGPTAKESITYLTADLMATSIPSSESAAV